MSLRDLALGLVVGCAYLRVTAILFGAVRSLRGRHRTRATRFGVVELLAAAETVVLAAIAYPLYRAALDSAPSTGRTVGASIGAVLALVYVALLVGTLASWRGAHSGHLVFDDQTLVTTGLYGMIRHPLYAGALVLWAAVAVADLSIVAAVVTVAFVAPVYLAYVSREEEMMRTVFGDAYDCYCSRVPRFVPSVRQGHERPQT